MTHRGLALPVLTVVALTVAALADPPLLAQGPQQHIDQWIRQLGSSKFPERDRAMKDLEAAGALALPALRQATHSQDAEIRQRAALLVRSIEAKEQAAALLAPKKIRLVLKDKSPSAAVAELALLSGYPVLLAADPTALSDRKVTIDTGLTTFWDALEQLCRAADLKEVRIGGQIVDSVSATKKSGIVGGVKAGKGGKAPGGGKSGAANPAPIVLADGRMPLTPVSQAGSFRIRVLPASLLPVQGALASPTTLFLQIHGEPRLQDCQIVGKPLVERAVDNLGQSLTFGLELAAFSRVGDGDELQLLNSLQPMPLPRGIVALPLQRGDKPATQLAELTGKLTVEVTKQNEPLATIDNILLAAGNSATSADGRTMRVTKVETNAQGEVVVLLTLEMPASPLSAGGKKASSKAMTTAGLPRFFDDAGRELPFLSRFVTKSFVANDQAVCEATLTYRPLADQQGPVRLVLVGPRTTTIVVPFSFKNVPLP